MTPSQFPLGGNGNTAFYINSRLITELPADPVQSWNPPFRNPFAADRKTWIPAGQHGSPASFQEDER